MKHKILFITCNNYKDTSYGGGQCSNRNFQALEKFGDVTPYYITKRSTVKSAMAMIGGFFPPTDFNDLMKIIRIIENERPNIIFFDGSIFGKLSKIIRPQFPYIKIITFFHNVETDYIDVRFGKKWIKHLYRYFVEFSEKRLISDSDKIIVLSKRDKDRIKDLYNRESDMIIPITFEDKASINRKEINAEDNKKYCLIVGSMKRDTYEGVEWFVKSISPNISVPTVIVGKGFEHKRDALSGPNIEVVGTVDDISKYYNNARFVAIPILSGAGMKVKTAEALMYGNFIFGTSEAFEGYELDYDQVGGLCDTEEEFIHKISAFLDTTDKNYCDYSRKIFEEKFSKNVSDRLYRELLQGI